MDAASRLVDVVVQLSEWPQAGFLETVEDDDDGGRLLLSRDSNNRASALVWVGDAPRDPAEIVEKVDALASLDRADLRYLATTDGLRWRWLRWTGDRADLIPEPSTDWAVCPQCDKRTIRTMRLKSSFSTDAQFVVCDGDHGPFVSSDGTRCLELDALSYEERALVLYLRCMDCGCRFPFPGCQLEASVAGFPARDMTTDMSLSPDVAAFFVRVTGRSLESFGKRPIVPFVAEALRQPLETELELQSEWIDENAGFDFLTDPYGDLPMPTPDDLEGWSRVHDAYEVQGGNILLWALYTADN